MIKIKRNLSIAILSVIMAVAFIFAIGFNLKEAKADTPTFEMEGAWIRFDEPTGIRFTAIVDAKTYQSVIDSEDKVFGGIILPNDYLGEIGEITNHVTQLGGIDYNSREGLLGTEDGDEYRLSYSITEIQYGNYNRDFYGSIYIKTGTGSTATYQYATAVADNNIRNVASVAQGYYVEAEEEEKADLLNFIFKAEYLGAHPTDSEGEPYADAYATSQINSISGFYDAVAALPATENIAYKDYSNIKSAKENYGDLGAKGQALVAGEYRAVLTKEGVLSGVEGRIFGDYGMTADLYTQDTGDANALSTVTTSVIAKNSNVAGQSGYVYKGELGNLIKFDLDKGSNGNWAVNAQFDKVLAVMTATEIGSVSFYIYSNNTFNPTIHVGTYWNPFYYESIKPGWKKITYTLAQVESIVNKRNAICSDGTFKDSAVEAELWISDFFLSVDDSGSIGSNKVWGTDFDGAKFTKVDNGWANTTISTTATLLDRVEYQGLDGYVYGGEYGRLVKIIADAANNDSNWALSFPATEVQTAMTAAGADYVEMRVYNNSSNTVKVNFGGWPDVGQNGKEYRFNSGWNVVHLSLAEIGYMVAGTDGEKAWKQWIGHNNVGSAELWITDFTLLDNETSGRVWAMDSRAYSLGGSNKDKYDIERNVAGATAEYVSADTRLEGRDGYVYNGEYGSLVKINMEKKDVEKGKHWAIKYYFAEAKAAMESSGATSVTLHIYANKFNNEYIMFGSQWVIYQKLSAGWNTISFTKAQIDTIVSYGALICSDGDGMGSATEAECWVSDFFLNT